MLMEEEFCELWRKDELAEQWCFLWCQCVVGRVPCALLTVDSECLGPDVAVSTRKGMRGTPVCSTHQCPWESQHFHIAVVQQNVDDIGLCGMWTTIVYTSLPCLPIIGKYIMQIALESTKHCIIRSYIMQIVLAQNIALIPVKVLNCPIITIYYCNFH